MGAILALLFLSACGDSAENGLRGFVGLEIRPGAHVTFEPGKPLRFECPRPDPGALESCRDACARIGGGYRLIAESNGKDQDQTCICLAPEAKPAEAQP